MTYEHLDVVIENEVAWATMNRPERLNALNPKLVDELRDFFVGLYWRRDVRVVVLRGAGRAWQLGLISRIVETEALEGEARAFAADMLHATPLGLRLTKEALNHAIDANGLEAAIAMEDRNQILCVQDGDFGEGVRAFLEKREPDYRRG